MIDEKYLTIIDKHVGEKLFALYVMEGAIRTRYGKLTETYTSKFTLHDIASDKEIKLNYFKDPDNYVLALYNYHCVNLLRAKTPMKMQAKIDLSASSSIILPKLKENQNEPVDVITFDLGRFSKINGILSDLGMRDLIVSTGKNNTLSDRIPYNNIIHIFDSSCSDIIAT